MGVGALKGNTTGAENTALGLAHSTSNNTGSNNIAVGHQALYTNGATTTWV